MENHSRRTRSLSGTADGIPASYTILVFGLLFLYFFQLLADFIAAIYAFGLLNTSLPVEVISALLLLAPVILVFRRKAISGKPLAFLGTLVLFCRVIEPLLDTRSRMFASGLGVASFLIFFPAFLSNRQHESDSQTLGIGLGLGLSASILLRTLGSGIDLSMMGVFQIIGWVLAVLGGVYLFRITSTKGQSISPAHQPGDARAVKVIGLSLGIAAIIVLLYFVFSGPAVIARWTEASYFLILVVLLLALTGFIGGMSFKPGFVTRLTTAALLIGNVLFVASLTLTILVCQVRFPLTPTGYPFTSAPPPIVILPLLLMLLLSPIVLVDFTLLSREIIAEKPSIRLLGVGFTLGALLILLMTFAQVFTTVYDYIPVVGPLFRDKFWLVFLAGGAVLSLSMLLVRRNSSDLAGARGTSLPVISVAIIALGTITGAGLTASRPPVPTQSADALRVLTYNIQQGYSRDGQIGFESQLTLMRQTDADIIGLQECDTTRIANGNIDVVRYFADRLNMYSYYGPNTTVGTFGIALLSKYPIQHPRTFYMYSQGEQTAIIEAQIVINGKTFNVYVTHLGNGGPIIQQEQVLELVQGKPDVLLMGDFNFRPDTDQYELTTGTFSDSWLLGKSQPESSPEAGPDQRIDYLYVSPGTMIIDSRYLDGPQSDHPALVTDIGF